jgi:gluconolactonase
MFGAPPEIAAEIWTRLPAQFRDESRRSEWLYARGDGTAHSFLEGPSFDRAGNLWVTDIPHGRIFRISPAGEWTLAAEYDGEPNGLVFHRDDWAAITDARRGLLRLDPATGAVSPLLPRVRREGFRGLNDCTFAHDGELYFTDQGQTGLHDPVGRVYRLRAGAPQPEMLVANAPSPNGLVLTADGHTLYLAVTRDNAIWRVPLTDDGGVIRVGRFIQLSGGLGGPDGLAMDQAGNLAIAHVGLGCAWLFSRLGEPMLRIRSPAGLSVTNLAYGGEGNAELFMTESESGSILRARMPVPGARLYGQA